MLRCAGAIPGMQLPGELCCQPGYEGDAAADYLNPPAEQVLCGPL